MNFILRSQLVVKNIIIFRQTIKNNMKKNFADILM
jgi:hypothetical protein